jgi:trehalose 6-phosphate synthase/phosphatase
MLPPPRYTGAAQTLGSGAILVNPFNTDAVAAALYGALHMPEAEREVSFAPSFAARPPATRPSISGELRATPQHVRLRAAFHPLILPPYLPLMLLQQFARPPSLRFLWL